MKLKELINNFKFDYSIVGDFTGELTGVSSYKKAKPGDISFIEQKPKQSNEEVLSKILDCRASVMFIPRHIHIKYHMGKVYIYTEDPKYAFVKTLLQHYSEAFLFEKAKNDLPSTTRYTDTTYIAHDAKIGTYCKFGPGVVIYPNTTIGDYCTIMPNTVIGGPGFGHVVNKKTGEQIPFPHIGGVIIGNNVRIGSNTCIDRGTLDNTVIGDNVRIDNLVHIAHNVEIGKNSMIVANCMIGGSVKIGDNTWVGPSTSVLNQLTIGNNSFIGMAACVVKPISDNKLAYGFPAKEKE